MDGISVLTPSTPENQPAMYSRGNAVGWLSRSDKTAAAPYNMAGRLYLAKSGWLLLSVPNAFVRGVFDALTAPGAELPTTGLMNVPNVDGDILNAHISVMTADEVKKIGADKINERGHMFHYALGPVEEIPVHNVDGVSKVWAVQIKSPALAALRKSYGLAPYINDNHQFHITVAARRKNVLGNNEVSKFDAATGRGEWKAAADDKTTYDCSCSGPCMCPATCVCRKHGQCGCAKTAEEQQRVRVVLPYNGQYLLETLNNPKWPENLGKRRFIGGGIETGETPEQAAAREMFEELGVKIKPTAFKHLGKDPNKQHEHYVELTKHKLQPGNFNATVGSDAVISLARGLPSGADYMGADIKKLLPAALKKAAELPWRERAEVYARDPATGKIYGGKWDNDGTFALPGGGIDPGEDPAVAALRELKEETGITANNARLLPIPPVDLPWSDKVRAEKAKQGRGGFAGSRTHFVVADIVNHPKTKNLDYWAATNRGYYDPADALAIMKSVKKFNAPAVAAGRIAALKHIIENAAKKTAAADPATTILVSGHSGAGKSTLSKALAEKLNIPLHQIDSHPDQKAFFAVNKDGQETVVGSPVYEEFQKLRKRTAEETLAGINGPAIVEGAQLAALSPEQLSAYKNRVFVHTPLKQLLKQRLDRQRTRQIAKGNEWTPELESKKQQIGRAVYDSQNSLMRQYERLPGTLKYTTRKDDIAALISKLTKSADLLPGGLADNMPDKAFSAKELAKGKKHEHEHTDNDQIADEIAKDHLQEDPDYYKKHAEEEVTKEPAIIFQLRKAKEHSDAKRYKQKNEILRRLMHRAPDDWTVDDPEPYHMGVTHLPTRFRFHADPKIIPVGVPVQKAASKNPYLAHLFDFTQPLPVKPGANPWQMTLAHLKRVVDRGNWTAQAQQNTPQLFAAMDPNYKHQMNMSIARGEWPKPDILTQLIQRHGGGVLASLG